MSHLRGHRVPVSVWALAILLAAAALAQPQTRPMVWPQSRPIVVWKVGSPYEGETPDTATPPELTREARAIGTSLVVVGLPALGFAARFFQAFETGDEPDILVINNYGLIEGATTKLGSFTGINSSELVKKNLIFVRESLGGLQGHMGGWEFLIASSRNHNAARTLALRALGCPPEWRSAQSISPELQQITTRIGSAYLEGATATVTGYEDEARLATVGSQWLGVRTRNLRTCGNWGNDRIAFVPLLGTFESETSLGTTKLLIVLRKAADQWRVLAVASDPVSTGDFVLRAAKLPHRQRSLRGTVWLGRILVSLLRRRSRAGDPRVAGLGLAGDEICESGAGGATPASMRCRPQRRTTNDHSHHRPHRAQDPMLNAAIKGSPSRYVRRRVGTPGRLSDVFSGCLAQREQEESNSRDTAAIPSRIRPLPPGTFSC